MKNIVRTLALALVATGAVASNHINSASAQTALAPRASAFPVPMCVPDGTTDCGLCKITGTCAR